MILYCTQCGQPVRQQIPAGDNMERAVCNACGHIEYENPKLIVGCIAEWDKRILLCRRAIAPQEGFWTLPAGFMENGESSPAAAARETEEEACARVTPGPLFALVDIPCISQVHLFYRGELLDGHHAPGIESLETRLCHENEIPWEHLAFRSIRFCLERYLEDRRKGAFGLHHLSLSAT